jgi:site-specific DNA recombinase
MKVIIYARISTEGQKKGYSLQEQIDTCKKRAFELGAKEHELLTYSDVETGEFLNRIGFTKILHDLEEQKIDYFICYDPDRLSRSLTTALVAIDMIEKKEVKIEFINTNYDKTPEGRLFFQIRAVIAEYEKEKIKIRTMMGKAGKAKRKLLTHNPGLYGYDYDLIDDTLSINEEEAKVIRMMISWVFEEENIGIQRIAERLNSMNILPPRGKKVDKKTNGGKGYIKEEGFWQKGTVKRILNNYSYTGTLYIQTVD